MDDYIDLDGTYEEVSGLMALSDIQKDCVGRLFTAGMISSVACKNVNSSFFGSKPLRLILPDLLDL